MAYSRIVRALVFSRKNMGEADRLVQFFTKEDGLLRVIAKGVRKMPSARGGHLEPFTCVDVSIHESKSGIYAGSIETEHYFQTLKADPDSFLRAMKHTQLFFQLFTEHQVVPGLFDVLYGAWGMYPTLSNEKKSVLFASITLLLLQHAGVLPDIASRIQSVDQKYIALVQYLVDHPEDAGRIVLMPEDAHMLERIINNLVQRAVVYS